jgi:hypothetical protein
MDAPDEIRKFVDRLPIAEIAEYVVSGLSKI